MIKRIISHRWIRPRYSSVVMEVVPLLDDGTVAVTIHGREPSTTPKSISISCATSEGGPYDLLVESLELMDVTMRMLVPLASSSRFLRFDFFGTIAPVEGTVKHQVYVTIDAAAPTMATPAQIASASPRVALTALTPPPLSSAAAMASPRDGHQLHPLQRPAIDVHAWLGVGSPARTATSALESSTPISRSKQSVVVSSAHADAPNSDLAQVAAQYAEAYAVAELQREVRLHREQLDDAERRLVEEKQGMSSSMAVIQRRLDEEHASQLRRSGLYHRERQRFISSLRQNVKTPDVRGLAPPLPRMPSSDATPQLR